MATKHRTKKDTAWLEAIREFGCVACFVQGTPGTPSEAHHIREGQGRGQRSDHQHTIPLCPPHHRGTMHPTVPSIHRDKLKFIDAFGTEEELYQLTRDHLNYD